MKQLTTSVGVFGPFASIETLSDRYRCDDAAEYPFTVVGNDATIEDYVAPPPAPVVVPVPTSVSMRQAQLELYDAGLLDDVEALVATLPRPYQIEWAKAGSVERSNALVELVRVQQGLTVEYIDNLFIRADAR